MARKKELGILIRTIFEKGDASDEGKRAIEALAQHGKSAIDAMIAATKKLPKSNLHPRDVMDSVHSVFAALARMSSGTLVQRMREGAIDPILGCSALGNARGLASLRVLVQHLQHQQKWVRWSAMMSLVRRRARSAAPTIVSMLKDRSSTNQIGVIHCMMQNQWLRLPDAIPMLDRFLVRQSAKKSLLHYAANAQTVIDMIRDENGLLERPEL